MRTRSILWKKILKLKIEIDPEKLYYNMVEAKGYMAV
mgnify:CR=1 FL=1